MGIPGHFATIFFYLLVAAALFTLHWSITHLQPPPARPSAPLLNHLLGINLRPLSTTSAFLLCNAIILAILLLSVWHDPPPPPQQQPPAHINEAYPHGFLPALPEEEDVYCEDKTMCIESSASNAHAPTSSTSKVAQRCRKSRRSGRELLDRGVTWEGTGRGAFPWLEADVDIHWTMPIGIEKEEVAMEEEKKKDELWERADAFIGKQMNFVKSEEAMLVLAAEASSSGALVATGGP